MSRPAIHPGEILSDELEEVGVSASELARQIKVPANRLSMIISGKRSITGDTALRLGHWFGNSAQFWLNLQTAYELRLAAEAAGPEIEGLPFRARGCSSGPRQRRGSASKNRTASPPDAPTSCPSHITRRPRTIVPTGQPVTDLPS